MESYLCRVCGNSEANKPFRIREMQLGLREEFEYFQCAECGSMQITEIPADLGRFYSNDNYYSFRVELKRKGKSDFFRKIKSSYLLFGNYPFAGRLLCLGYKVPQYYTWLKNTGVDYGSAILDVGTGNGSFLLQLRKIGFTNLLGIDPFIDEEQQYGDIRILKKDIFEVEGKYDFIILNHSFEHMDEPGKVLGRIRNLLLPGRMAVVRIPVMDMYCWKKYGVNWVDLDAPRHIFIPTIKGMKLLTDKAGFEIRKIEFDSEKFSIWASEQYAMDIPLSDPRSFRINKHTTLFTKEKMKEYESLAKQNNEGGRGDYATFYIVSK